MQQSHTNLIEVFRSIHRNKSVLLEHQYPVEMARFLIEWYLFSEDQTKKAEQIYVWSLLYGWSLADYAEKKDLQRSEPQYQEEQGQNSHNSCLSQQLLQKQSSFVYFLGKNQAIIKQSDTIFWANPKNLKPQVLSSFQAAPHRLIVLTSSEYFQLFQVLALINLKVSFKIITLEPIYKKLKLLLGYLQRHEQPEYSNTSLSTIYFLKGEEYFEYGGFLWLATSCCWYEPCYDLVVTPTGSKDNRFLIESPKLNDVKFIYYGWKKNIITECNYIRYSANQPQKYITAKTGTFHQIARTEGTDSRKYRYLDFIQKDLFKSLDEIDQEQVWNCCEEIELTAGQTIVRKGTTFDHIFVLFEGQFEYIANGSVGCPADKSMLYGLQELREGRTHNCFSLKCMSKGTVLRIAKHNLKFLLYDYFE